MPGRHFPPLVCGREYVRVLSGQGPAAKIIDQDSPLPTRARRHANESDAANAT